MAKGRVKRHETQPLLRLAIAKTRRLAISLKDSNSFFSVAFTARLKISQSLLLELKQSGINEHHFYV